MTPASVLLDCSVTIITTIRVRMAGLLRLLILGVLVLNLGACTTDHKPGHDAVQTITPEEARNVVNSGAKGYWVPIENGERVDHIAVLYSGIRIVPRSGQAQFCKFRDFEPIVKVHPTRLGYSIELKGCSIKSKYGSNMYLGYDFSLDQARRLANAIHVLKRRYLSMSGPDTQSTSELFEAAVRQYRSDPESVALPEEALMLERRAEVAANENRVDDAIEHYTRILERVPAWPEGYYRRGTLNGEIGEYAAAIRDLNKYLRLEPGSQTAQTAKTLVYQWRSKLLDVKPGR